MVRQLYPGGYASEKLLNTRINIASLVNSPVQMVGSGNGSTSVHLCPRDEIPAFGGKTVDLAESLVVNVEKAPSADAWLWHRGTDGVAEVFEGMQFKSSGWLLGERNGEQPMLMPSEIETEYKKVTTPEHLEFYGTATHFLAMVSNKPHSKNLKNFRAKTEALGDGGKGLLGVVVVCKENFCDFASPMFAHVLD